MSDRKITIRMPDNEVRDLDSAVKALGVSRSEFIRRAIAWRIRGCRD